MKKIEKLNPTRLSLKKETVTRLEVNSGGFNPGGNDRFWKKESDACPTKTEYSCNTWSQKDATCLESLCVCQSCQQNNCAWL